MWRWKKSTRKSRCSPKPPPTASNEKGRLPAPFFIAPYPTVVERDICIVRRQSRFALRLIAIPRAPSCRIAHRFVAALTLPRRFPNKKAQRVKRSSPFPSNGCPFGALFSPARAISSLRRTVHPDRLRAGRAVASAQRLPSWRNHLKEGEIHGSNCKRLPVGAAKANAERHSIADRMDRIPTTKHTTPIVFFALMSWFVECIDLGGTSYLLPAIREYSGMDEVTGGCYSSICHVGLFIGAIAAGRIADKTGRKKIMVICMAIWGVAGIVHHRHHLRCVHVAGRAHLARGSCTSSENTPTRCAWCCTPSSCMKPTYAPPATGWLPRDVVWVPSSARSSLRES